MNGSKNSYENQVQAYKQKLTKYESVIKEKEAEYEAERSKLPKLRKRSLDEIKNEIQELRNDLWRSKPKKKCPNGKEEIDYDSIVCWHCGGVPKRLSQVQKSKCERK